MIYCKNCYGDEEWYQYDENGDIIEDKDSITITI